MAAARTKAAPIGSSSWIATEREQVTQFVDQEVEEFSFSVRNELEWLNEHMAEVFSQGSVNLADVFKTPGKLRGKTPRTARKRDALAPRQPLTDIFAPNLQQAPPSSTRKPNAFLEKVAQFQIAEDQQHDPQQQRQQQQQRPSSRSKSPQRVGKPCNTDSGYHGMTEDEMEMDAKTETVTASSQDTDVQKVPLRDDQTHPQPIRLDTAAEGQTSDDSFLSAKEDLESRNPSREQLRSADTAADDVKKENVVTPLDDPTATTTGASEQVIPEDDMVTDTVDDVPASPSDNVSSPAKPLQRKSSFTFSALPARENLPGKRSIGTAVAQVDVTRQSALGRSIGARSVFIETEDHPQEKPEGSVLQSKTSTQLLHERITLLGKSREPRTSKSIAQAGVGGQATYPKLPISQEMELSDGAMVERPYSNPTMTDAEIDDDDWINPTATQQATQTSQARPAIQPSNTPEGSPIRPGLHQKSISTTNIPSPTRPILQLGHQKAQSVSNPNLAAASGTMMSATPQGSPMAKKHHEGPLSASKNKLWSALKSAKNIFASSASASAAAKLEAHNSPSIFRSPKRDFSDESKTAAVYNMPGALYSERQLPQSPNRPISIASTSPSRKTRSSDESDRKREKDLKAQQKAADELDKAREKERQKAAKQLEERRKAEEAEAARLAQEKQQRETAQVVARPATAESDRAEMPPPPPPKTAMPAGKLRAAGQLMRPTRAEPNTKPAPVSIRIASQSQRLGQGAAASLSKSQHESTAPPPPPPPKTGLRTTSAQSNVHSSTAPNNARLKALEAAAKKKEADEKAAARKLEQKRELERKRAAKLEEERRAEEEKKAMEQARLQEAKMAAQRKADQHAAETRKREQQRLEQLRLQEEAQKAKAAHELAESIKRERAQQQTASHYRGDVGGTLRQLAKNTVVEQPPPARPVIHTNPAKPAKRALQVDEEQQYAPAPQRPGPQRAAPSFQQEGAKRRRTDEEQEPEHERHSVMAPPKRPSNLRKESTAHRFPHGYTHAPPPASHHVASMFKSTVTAQHQLQHAGKPIPSHPSQTVQLSNARIPFAENANPPAAHNHPAYQQQMHPGFENAIPGANPSSKFKTPVRPAQTSQKSAAKSSPLYPNGDAIQLPEILTDSEEEDSEDESSGGFRAPSWADSPALRELLTQQQLVDPETVFGPIAELKMEEVFKGSKNQERLKKFRDRGSSAAWVESGDAVTSAEKRRDMEMRERVVREGGWRYEPTR